MVGPQLVLEADAAPFLAHVEEHAPALGRDPLEREIELRAAVAERRAEQVAGQAFGMDARQHRLLERRRADVADGLRQAEAEREVRSLVDLRAIDVDLERRAEAGR